MLCKKIEIPLFGVCTVSGILASVCCLATYHNVFVPSSGINNVHVPESLLPVLCLHFVAARDRGNTASSATAAGKCKCSGGGGFASSA